MAAVVAPERAHNESNGTNGRSNGTDDPFLDTDETKQQPYFHRYSSRFELDAADFGPASSPSQVKRVLEAHLLETERRLQDTHKLGTSLLQQQSELQDKLQEVEQQHDEAEISPELKQRLALIGREHDDVSREIARSLLPPKSRAVSGEEKSEATTLTSQATGSPTKLTAPSRRQRNQPTNRAGDLQFAADISTSLLAQVRQLQAAVAERDETIKAANAERSTMEQDLQLFTQKLRTHDENVQQYKDQTWNLEAQNHELLSAQREALEKEKRLSVAIAAASAEKTRLLGEMEESRLAHHKALEEHDASKKAHETEMHSLKRNFDEADLDRSALQNKLDELTVQNQELAKAMASRLRNQSPQRQTDSGIENNDVSRDLSTPEHSPPPSPTKATPRHGGLESETLRSSLHHAHRTIQNLKGNIHREKTEKIELKRMLQEARDELEQRRSDPSFGSGSKKQKTKSEAFKKPPRPDMLGNSRRPRTDVEMVDEDWEDQANEGMVRTGTSRLRSAANVTDLSDAYQTAHETESNFETADELQTTESEAFETGAESLAGDSSEELTETESTATGVRREISRINRPSLGFRSAGTRDSYLSTASTSAGEEDDSVQTPIQPQMNRFRLRNGRSSAVRNTQIFEGTPDSIRTQATATESPATVVEGRSPPAVEQSLFAELEGINDGSSNFSTPARSGILDLASTPSISDTPSRSVAAVAPEPGIAKPLMVDSATMTEPWQPEPSLSEPSAVVVPDSTDDRLAARDLQTNGARVISIGDFPLPPNAVTTPVQHNDMGTQYTPQKGAVLADPNTPQYVQEQSTQFTPSRSLLDSPVRSGNNFITPPKTVWDAEHESEIGSPERSRSTKFETPRQLHTYSTMLSKETVPISPTQPHIEPPSTLAYSAIVSQQTRPIAPQSSPPTAPLPAIPTSNKQERSNGGKVAAGAATGGILAGAAAALGLSWAEKEKETVPAIVEDATSGPREGSLIETQSALQDVSGNTVLPKKSIKNEELLEGRPVMISSNDQSSQTMLTSNDIEQALHARKNATRAPITISPTRDVVPELPSKARARSPELASPHFLVTVPVPTSPTSPPLRPSSSSSTRPLSANINKQHPPLPLDYKTNIARANSLLQNNNPKRESNTPAVGSVMGPPSMPASAMRRPKTPVESARSPARENATPRITHSRQRGNTDSQLSRRSSVSSFASEIDERFNIRAGPSGVGYESAPGTDPRMIQAITQTMIGEYLWKYTRKTGGKEMSNTRHRRYFWVHPYTKTLYWSSTDPSVPGAKEITSRSVPIESIRVVSDDNPMPPGLHRKSIEITTPSRKVKFTATTTQRHETWFNALSYLLLRGDAPDTYGAYSTGGNEVTRDDLEEFRAGNNDPHLVPNSRQSMSSYNSRTTSGTAKRVSGPVHTGQRQPMPSNVVSTASVAARQPSVLERSDSVPPTPNSGRASRAEQSREFDKNRTIRAHSMSRVSRVLGSITGRTSRQGARGEAEIQQDAGPRGPSRGSNSIYDASVVPDTRDSAEEMRQEMLKQEPGGAGSNGGLENVRACCDGKHDVSTLNHTNRHMDRHPALNSMSDRINRSMSKRV